MVMLVGMLPFGAFASQAEPQTEGSENAPHEHAYTAVVSAPTCTKQGYTTHTCACGDSYVDSYTDQTGHSYVRGVCSGCGTSKLSSEWLVPDFAQGDYTMVVLPDAQNLVQYWPEIYYDQMQWIADHRDVLNIQAVFHMGDMVNNNDTEWTVCRNGMDIIDAAGIHWMPMRGNHDNTTWFNRYYDYATYGAEQSWFGGSYEEGKLDHTYWFVTVGNREYMILSMGWAPSWDVTSLLADRQDDDTKNHYSMVALLTFHADSDTVDVNWYSTYYDALFRTKNQFSITVPPCL